MEMINEAFLDSMSSPVSINYSPSKCSFYYKGGAAGLAILSLASLSTGLSLTESLFTIDSPAIVISYKNETAETISTKEKLETILHFFSLGKSQLRTIIGVSRQIIYNWLDESKKPDSLNMIKIDKLFNLAKKLDPEFSQPLYSGYVEDPINGFSKSVIDIMISDPDLSSTELNTALNAAYRKTSERNEYLNMPKFEKETRSTPIEKKGYNLDIFLQDITK